MTTASLYDGEKTMTTDGSPDDLLIPREAAAYLSRKWGRPFTVKDLRNLRHNRHIDPAVIDTRYTLWRRGDLDNIEEPPRLRPEIYGKPGKPRPKQQGDLEP